MLSHNSHMTSYIMDWTASSQK
uniref:Uncharacterized protein n=1 Tax=Rhizophora mucronata TaxID=61149 RepID=A0A2P2P816_RHIMU